MNWPCPTYIYKTTSTSWISVKKRDGKWCAVPTRTITGVFEQDEGTLIVTEDHKIHAEAPYDQVWAEIVKIMGADKAEPKEE